MYSRNVRIIAFIFLILFLAAVLNAWKFGIPVLGLAPVKLIALLTIAGVVLAYYLEANLPPEEDLSSQDMFVDILSNGVVIGRSNLDRLDPPMGVATGSFVATDAYDRTLHANVIEDDEIGDRGKLLVIQSGDHGRIPCAAVSIEDYSDGLGEIEISVLGIPYPEYESFFCEHDHYRDYYGLD